MGSMAMWPMRVIAVTACLAALGAGPAEAQVEYYHLDAIGSVRVVTDGQGNVIERHDYLPFGEECTTGPCAANPKAAAGQTHKFTAKERDTETGLDYFGARYQRASTGRFTTVDPVMTIEKSLVDPQRWNRYAYSLNNPLRYVDPDGREVQYASSQLQSFFTGLAQRSATVRGTLDLFTGPGRPNLIVTHEDAGRDIDGSEALGTFKATGYNVDYAANADQIKSGMSAEAVENLGAWSLNGGVLTLDASVALSLRDKKAVTTAVHELGHADQAARSPLQYKRDAAAQRHPNGSPIPHDSRPAEIVANRYAERAVKEVRP